MESALPRMNETGTCTEIDTPLTQPRSGFDLRETRRALIAKRVKAGAKTPLGHRYSNLIEQLQSLSAETDPQARRNLRRLISASVSDIRRLTSATNIGND